MLWVGAVCRGCERRGHLSCQLDLMLDGAILAAGATDAMSSMLISLLDSQILPIDMHS